MSTNSRVESEAPRPARIASGVKYVCPFNQRPCEVIESLPPAFLQRRGREAQKLLHRLASLSDCLPCEHCRSAELAAQRLDRVRLGRHERNILLHAPGPEAAQGAILDPSLRTHSERETYLRAVRKLTRAGLARSGTQAMRLQTNTRRADGTLVSRAYAHRTLRLTPLGVQVVESYRNELENGKPVRWARRLPQALARVRLPTAQLVPLYASRLEERLAKLQPADEPSQDPQELKALLQAARQASAPDTH